MDDRTDSFLHTPFHSPEISLFWEILISITPCGTQKVSIWSSLLTSSLNECDITTLLHRSPDIYFAPPSLALLCSWEGFRTWVVITYQFYQPPLFLRSFTPTSIPLSSIFRKLPGIALPITFTLIVLLQRILASFSFLSCCSLYFFDIECGQILHSFWPHQTTS